MAKTQPAWQPGDPSPASGGELVRYRPATTEEWAAFTHREASRALPPRVDSASPDQVAELGELWVDEATGYKTRVKPDAGAGDSQSAQTGDRSGTRSDAGAASQTRNGRAKPRDQANGQAAGQSDQADELARLRAENEQLKRGGGGQA